MAPVLLLAVLLLLPFGRAIAHDQKHPELNSWFKSLHSGNGFIGSTPCCDSEEEAHHLTDVDWDMQCEQNNFGETKCHYRVFLYNRWWDVPAASVVEGPNRLGLALVWEMPTREMNGEVLSVFIRCFMPGAGI